MTDFNDVLEYRNGIHTPTYAGIGSRQTPIEILNKMETLGWALAKMCWILRSGGSPGADTAFANGVDIAGPGRRQIFLPWKSFNANPSDAHHTHTIPAKAFEIAESLHGFWSSCTPGGKKLLARNCQQILGLELDSPCAFVLYWSPAKIVSGGTAIGVNLAEKEGIPTYNLLDPAVEAHIMDAMAKQFSKWMPLPTI